MASQNKSDMSMNEILKSIKNFVSVGDVETEALSRNEANIQPVAHAVGERLLSSAVSQVLPQEAPSLEEERFLSTEEKMQRLDKLNMPEFMHRSGESRATERNGQDASKVSSRIGGQPVERIDRDSESGAFPVIAPRDEGRGRLFEVVAPSSVTGPEASPEPDLSERSGVKAAFQHFANTVEDLVHPKPMPAFQGGLDQMMIEAIQSSVETWLDQHMQGIVEDLVQQEIAKITQTILERA